MASNIHIPSRIADRVRTERIRADGIFVTLNDPYSDETNLAVEFIGDERVRYSFTARDDSPTYNEDLDDFFALEAAVLAANVRERPTSVKDLTFREHRIIDEYARPEDRRVVRREYLKRRFILSDRDDWNDAAPVAVTPDEDGPRRSFRY
jgi:hypothetical protein